MFTNYRPITLLSASSKVFERLIYNRPYSILDKYNNLFIDFSKAFDSLDNNILLDKLWHYGVRGVPHKSFKSYLEHRKQFVINIDTMSDYQSTKYGVPQGSILGPLLFNIYINVMLLSSHTAPFILFADDTSILFKSKDLSSLTINVNSELTKNFHLT